MPDYTLSVNGARQTVTAPADTPLLWILREHLQLTGTKYGCGVGQCRVCTVHLDGAPTFSCLVPVQSAVGKAITTIEGIAADGPHAVQRAFQELDVPQCGYCQVGQIMSAVALLTTNPRPTDAEIDVAMEGVLCRCGTYNRVRAAIHRAAREIGR
jgi:isoquinoline 1-oxidoreductase alpha subunit